MPEPRGTPIHGEITSADASSGVKVQMYEPGGGTVTIEGATPTTNWGRVLNVTDLTLISVAGGAVKLESITGAATLTLFAGTVAANGGASRPFSTPFVGLRGGSLRLTAPAGRVDVQIEGYVTF